MCSDFSFEIRAFSVEKWKTKSVRFLGSGRRVWKLGCGTERLGV